MEDDAFISATEEANRFLAEVRKELAFAHFTRPMLPQVDFLVALVRRGNMPRRQEWNH